MADNYRVNDVNDPWYQYRNIIGVPSRKRIICGIIFVLFILTLVVIAFTLMSKMCCSKPDKLSPFAAFRSNLNVSVNPCVNFYKFTCGFWEQNNPLPQYEQHPHRVTTFSLLQKTVNNEKKYIFENTKQGKDLPRVVNYALQFYDICVEQNSSLADIVVLHDIFNKIGGWPILNKNDWNEDLFDWFQASAFLIRNSNLHTIIDVNAIDYNNSNGRNNIYLKPPDALIDDTSLSDSSTVQMLYSILISLNSSNLHEGVLDDIRNLGKVETKWRNLLAYSKDPEPLHISVKELIEQIPQFDWLKYFQLIMNSTLQDIHETITLNDTVVIQSFNYLEKVVKVLNTGEFTKLELANLFGWYVVKDIWIIIPDVLQNYAYAVSDSNDVKTAARDRCFDLIQDIFACSLDYLYVRNSSHLGIKDSKILTKYLKSAFKDILDQSSWVDKASKISILTRLNTMRDIIGFLSYLNNKAEFDKMYEEFPSFSQNILKYFFEIQQYFVQMRTLYLKLPVRPQDMVLPRSVSDASAYYIMNRNILVYPLSLHNPPFYYLYGPWFLNFGAIGAIIAHEIMHGFDNFTILNIDSDIYKKRSQCFIDQYNIRDNSGKYINNGTLTLRENIADSEGLRIAFHAYKKHEREIGYKQKYPSFENFTADQMFFISYGTVWCSRINRESHVSLFKESHSLPEVRVNKAVSNSEYFASAFGCPKESLMNPTEKCSLW